MLGELQVMQAGRVLPLGGPRNSALLALLLLHVNRSVRADTIAEQVWESGGSPSPGTVHAQVHRLRHRVGAANIETTRSGYRLRVAPDSVDARRFEAQLARAQAALTAGRSDESAEVVRAALDLWRGPALADLLDYEFAAREHSRLEELRREAEEVEAEALLVSEPAGVAATTERLVSDAPLRERRWALRIRALYAAGRQAEALEAYSRARRLLVNELGIEPGPELRGLQSQILHHDDVVFSRRSLIAPSGPLEVRYTRTTDGAYLAYETFGSGIPVVFAAGNWSGLTIRQNPLSAPYASELASLARVTSYDARGLGLSDPLGEQLPTADDRAQELIAVAEAAQAERFVVYGFSDGAAAAIRAATSVPERVIGLVLHNAAAAWSDERGREYEVAGPDELSAAYERSWGTGLTLDMYAPTLADDPVARRWWAHGERHAARAGEVMRLNAAAAAIDVRADLPEVAAPTLIIHAAANKAVPIEHARYLADHIAGSRLIETSTPDHALWSDSDVVLPQLRKFLRRLAARHGSASGRR
jgi:DNA-binding SARP family transcriptional activator/pimeloyl-ACP methyl ester carboxylesterase